MTKINLCILFGGVSPEHEVSLRSAAGVLRNLDCEKYNIYPLGITKTGAWILFGGDNFDEIEQGLWENNPKNKPAVISPAHNTGLIITDSSVRSEKLDCVFPVLHGENGEDGAMQGFLKIAGIPCVGSGVFASAAAMDKSAAKILCDFIGIYQADFISAYISDFSRDAPKFIAKAEGIFSYPVFVKPANAGSSVGIGKANDKEQLTAAVKNACAIDSKIIIEEAINAREIEVAVLGNFKPAASVCGEIIPDGDFYSYDSKYSSQSRTKLIIPAKLDENTAEQIRETAVRVYTELGCRGFARVDFFVEKITNKIYFNEINTIPGFTSISMYPKLFEASGIPYPKLIDRLVELAMEEGAQLG